MKSVNAYFSKYCRIAEVIKILESVQLYDHKQNPPK